MDVGRDGPLLLDVDWEAFRAAFAKKPKTAAKAKATKGKAAKE